MDKLIPGWGMKPNGTGHPWCCFAVWAWYRMAFSVFPLESGAHWGGVAKAYQLAQDRERTVQDPVPGDAFTMLYRSARGALTGKGHTGIIWGVSEDGDIFTIEGNVANQVVIGMRTRDQIHGFIDLIGDSADHVGAPWTIREPENWRELRSSLVRTR